MARNVDDLYRRVFRNGGGDAQTESIRQPARRGGDLAGTEFFRDYLPVFNGGDSRIGRFPRGDREFNEIFQIESLSDGKAHKSDLRVVVCGYLDLDLTLRSVKRVPKRKPCVFRCDSAVAVNIRNGSDVIGKNRSALGVFKNLSRVRTADDPIAVNISDENRFGEKRRGKSANNGKKNCQTEYFFQHFQPPAKSS